MPATDTTIPMQKAETVTTPDSRTAWQCRWSEWIAARIHASGEIRDPYSNNPLVFQYHSAAVILGRLCDPQLDNDDPTTRRVWEFLRSLPTRDTSVSAEFNAFLLTLAHFVATDRGADIADEFSQFIEHFPLPTLGSFAQRNRNFGFMLRFVLDYADANLDIDRGAGFRNALAGLLDGSQSADSLFIDTVATPNAGYASTAYVAKIALTFLLDGTINGSDTQFQKGRRAIDALLSMADVDRVLTYGRSQLSLFGYANLLLCCRLIAAETDSAYHARIAREINRMLASWQLPSGELALNPARNNQARPGFDQYMHAIVYNAYAWALIRIADVLAPLETVADDEDSSPETAPVRAHGVTHLADAGLIRHASERFDLLMSLQRCNNEPKLRDDARYQPCTPQLIRIHHHDVVPPIPKDMGGFLRLAVRRTLGERIASFLSAVRFVFSPCYFDDFLDRAGFLPYLLIGNHTKICPGTQSDNEVEFTDAGFQLRSAFALDALIRRRRLNRKQVATTPPISYGALMTHIQTSQDSIVIEHDLQLSENMPRSAQLVHLNLRLAKAPEVVESSNDATTFHFKEGFAIQHAPIAQSPLTSRCTGATGEVTYVRATESITANTTRHIRTILTFDGSVAN